MSERFLTKLHSSRLVIKYLNNSVSKTDCALDITGSKYYGLISSMLARQKINPSSKINNKYSTFEECDIWITEEDFFRYGWYLNPYQELRFEKLMRNIIIDDLLNRCAILKATFQIPTLKTIEYYMICYGFDEDDIKTDTLRKIYYRKYRDKENEYRKFNKEITLENKKKFKTITKYSLKNKSKIYETRKQKSKKQKKKSNKKIKSTNKIINTNQLSLF